MKKLHITLIGIAILFLTSCKEEVEKPKVTYDGMSKASICRTFEVKRSTLIDSLNRENI